MKRVTWKSALFIIVLATVGFLAPAGYLAWWGLFGGREREIECAIKQLIQHNPTNEAASAIRSHDYRLYSTGGPLNANAPGTGWTHEAYKDTFGYRGFTLFDGDPPTADQTRLNDAAIRYMTEYNRIIYVEVNRIHPNWSEEYEQKKRINSGQ